MALDVSNSPPDHVSRAFSAFGCEAHCSQIFPRAQKYPSRVALFGQSDPSESVFLLEHGLVKLMRLEQDGREMILGLRAAGWLIGAAAAILQRPHAVTALTVTPCTISRISSAEFQVSARRDPNLSWHLHEMHSREVFAELEQVVDLSTRSARDRLEQFLQRLAATLKPAGAAGEVRLAIPLRQWEIAQLIGVTPPYLSELIRELEQDGTLRREASALVLNPERAPIEPRLAGGCA